MHTTANTTTSILSSCTPQTRRGVAWLLLLLLLLLLPLPRLNLSYLRKSTAERMFRRETALPPPSLLEDQP